MGLAALRRLPKLHEHKNLLSAAESLTNPTQTTTRSHTATNHPAAARSETPADRPAPTPKIHAISFHRTPRGPPGSRVAPPRRTNAIADADADRTAGWGGSARCWWASTTRAPRRSSSGCHNDVACMRRCLVDRFGFDDAAVRVLPTPTWPRCSPRAPTSAVSSRASSPTRALGLFFHYSGHGTRLPAETGQDDDTGYDECIVPSDMNLITDQDFTELVQKVPDGCLFTIVSDSASGGLLDKAKEQIGHSTKQNQAQKGKQEERSDSGVAQGQAAGQQEDLKPAMEQEVNSVEEVYAGTTARVPHNGVLISGCQTDQTSADATTPKGLSYGALSNAIQSILAEKDRKVTNKEPCSERARCCPSRGTSSSLDSTGSDKHTEVAFC
ncbi:hypothetical protein ZWY2020_028681 [Hordeum vulgare]|nr:hypothetical protein ZWY2020_028681 [Hordeum vulgare]